MKEYKLAWRVYFFLILFTGVCLLGIRVIYMLLNGEVSDNGEEMSRVVAVVISLMLGVVLLSYIFTTLRLWIQLIKYDRCGLFITENGIENTVVFINVLAFVIVVPVRLIPWESVTYYDVVDKTPYIRVKTRLVKAGWIAKLLLGIMGYTFCYSFVKPNVEDADIEPYKYRFIYNIK